MKLHVTALILGLSLVSLASAQQPVVEESVEATSDTVSVTTALGRMTARSCTSCPERYLDLTSSSRFFIEETEVAFAEFKKALRSARAQGLTVHYRDEDKTVTRIVLFPAQ